MREKVENEVFTKMAQNFKKVFPRCGIMLVKMVYKSKEMVKQRNKGNKHSLLQQK